MFMCMYASLSAGCQKFIHEQLTWGARSELKTEVLHGLKEIGSALYWLSLLDIVLVGNISYAPFDMLAMAHFGVQGHHHSCHHDYGACHGQAMVRSGHPWYVRGRFVLNLHHPFPLEVKCLETITMECAMVRQWHTLESKAITTVVTTTMERAMVRPWRVLVIHGFPNPSALVRFTRPFLSWIPNPLCFGTCQNDDGCAPCTRVCHLILRYLALEVVVSTILEAFAVLQTASCSTAATTDTASFLGISKLISFRAYFARKALVIAAKYFIGSALRTSQRIFGLKPSKKCLNFSCN
ncbi:hypothetical protein ZIOFF_075219 [Zingiber officinale]|uniref:Uncharacterized protein n=1 Tax=Zingiber officinale TaxID=94328 RepID=A0A8J5EL16_ZINOF|nr:hypothetical protein ZIOFF_075219 [Zingiber officinale]